MLQCRRDVTAAGRDAAKGVSRGGGVGPHMLQSSMSDEVCRPRGLLAIYEREDRWKICRQKLISSSHG